MTDALWKQTERRIARLFGGVCTNRSGQKGADVTTPIYCIEVKERQHLPVWMVNAVKTARLKAGREKLGMAVLHEKGSRDDLVVLRVSDFKDWFGAVHYKGEGGETGDRKNS